MDVASLAVLPAAAEPATETASPLGEVVFCARGLAKVYRSGEVEVHALRDVDLEIRRGEFVVLLGASGSGKSTLLNILGGLDVPTAGEVRFADHVLTGATESDLTAYRREHVGFVFQFYNLIPSLTVRENLALVTDIAKAPMPIDEAIDLVGLTPRRDHFPAQLSGGEQQRVAIARAIVKRPEVLKRSVWHFINHEPRKDFTVYKRILVPIDGSDTGRRGLKEAIALATEQKSTLCLLHVMNDFPIMSEMPSTFDFEKYREELQQYGRNLLEDGKKLAASLGLEVETLLHDLKGGRVADAILQEAKSTGCDLIVIGTHGRRGFRRALLGSDAESVLRESSVPVLLVRASGALN